MLSYVIRYSPIYLILTIGMAFLSGLVSAANILLMRYVIDTAYDSGNLELVALFVLAITAMNILIGLAETTLSSIVLTKQQYKIQQKIQIELFSFVNRIQFKYYDNAEFYNQFALALNQAENRALGVAQTVTSFVGNITRISALLSIIVSLSPSVVLFILMRAAIHHRFPESFRSPVHLDGRCNILVHSKRQCQAETADRSRLTTHPTQRYVSENNCLQPGMCARTSNAPRGTSTPNRKILCVYQRSYGIG